MPGEIDVVEAVENNVAVQEVAKEVLQDSQDAKNDVPAKEVLKEVAVEEQNTQNNGDAVPVTELPVTELPEPELPEEVPQETQNKQEIPVIEPKQAQVEVEVAPPAPEPIIQQNGAPKKVTMATSLDTEAVRAAYDDVRSDNSETQWAVFKFDGQRIVRSGTGADFQKFREQFTENERAFGYIRIQTGDEMSKRQKFLFVTWVGTGVSVLKRAKMSTDKSVIKNIISNFAVELQLENPSEIDLDHFVEQLNKAGGANYGTGVREI